jgi:beta-lactamase regulating signal transducer with metallopeptidase domain
MHSFIEPLLINAATATLLALAAALVGRFVKRPAVMHVLWLLVLLKLLTPPLFEVAALPRLDTLLGGNAAAPEIPFQLLLALPLEAPLEDPGNWPAVVAVAIWTAGSLWLLLLATVRAFRFRRLLAGSPPARSALRQLVRRLSHRLGISSCPRVLLVQGRVPPMVWWRPGGSDLLLPAELLDDLEPAEREALIAHELAHVRRKDHWIRYVEIAATTLFWWHPVVWWARRNLRANEERSCDALVLHAFPGRADAYAEGLIKTLDFLVDRDPIVPAVATGAVGTRQLKERLTMIVNGTTPKRTTLGQRALLATVAAAALLVFPTWIDRAAAEDPPRSPQEERYIDEITELQRRAIELEHELRAVHEARIEVQRAMDLERARIRIEELQRRATEMRASGNPEEAEQILQRAEEIERASRLEAGQLEHELGTMRRTNQLETNLKRLLLEIDQLRVEGNAERAALMEREARELRINIEDMHVDADRQRQIFEEDRLAREMDALREKMLQAEQSGDTRATRELAATIAQLKAEHAQMAELMRHEQFERQRRAFELEERAAILRAELERAEQLQAETREEMELKLQTLETLRRELDKLHQY